MTPSQPRNGIFHGPAPSIGGPARRARRLPADGVAALAFLGMALVLHWCRFRPEGDWTIASAADPASVAGTLRIEPSGRYTLETADGRLPHIGRQGYWAASLDGFELHEVPWTLGRLGAFAVPVARANSDRAASLALPDGRSLILRRRAGG